MMRLGPLAVGVVLLAGAAFVDGLDDVRLRVYAYNETEAPAVVHVVVAREGRLVFDDGALVAPNATELVGKVHGNPGTYAWSVLFGRDSAHGEGRWERANGPLSVVLLPDGEVDVSVGVA